MAYLYADELYTTGTADNDAIFGSNGNDTIGGKGGDDIIFTRDGDDTVWDTLGDNWIALGFGNDFAVTGNGNDTLHGNEGDDYLQSGKGDDQVHGGAGNDHIRDIYGYNDISGGTGSDIIEFSASSHLVYGGDFGGTGDGEADTFVLASRFEQNVDLVGGKGDVIADFEVGLDILNLAQLNIQASQVTIGTYDNGYMVSIDTGYAGVIDLGVRTGTTGALTMSDIVVAA